MAFNIIRYLRLKKNIRIKKMLVRKVSRMETRICSAFDTYHGEVLFILMFSYTGASVSSSWRLDHLGAQG